MCLLFVGCVEVWRGGLVLLLVLCGGLSVKILNEAECVWGEIEGRMVSCG